MTGRWLTMAWQLQEAKQRFSELVRDAMNKGPQVITRHGEEVAVMISMNEYQRLSGDRPDFKEFLLSPRDRLDFDLLDLERSRELPREIDFYLDE
jgi:prevent-host-death family protein